MKSNLNRFAPHILALSVFIIITVAFFHPVFFEGKSIHQHDILMGIGTSQALREYRDATGKEGLWASSVFSGMPANLVGTIYSGDLMRYFQSAYSLWFPHPARLLLMSFFSMYILLFCAFKIRPYISLAGALAFGLTSFQIISFGAGHNAKIGAVAIMPLILAGIIIAFSGKLKLGFILTTLGLAIQFRINHLQITYYLLIICIIFGVNEIIVRGKAGTLNTLVKPIIVLIAAAILAVGTNLGRVWGVYEYSQYSIRGKSLLSTDKTETGQSGLDKEYAFQYSNGIFEPLVLFIPNFYGGSIGENIGPDSNMGNALKQQGITQDRIISQTKSVPTYWGDQPTSAPYYAGAITIFLFVLGLLVLEGRHKWWLLFAVILGIMLSLGKNFQAFNYFLFDYLPGYNKFRSVTFAIIISIFCLIALAFQGLEKFLSEGLTKSNQKKLFIAFGTTAGFAVLSILFAGMGSYTGGIDIRLSASGYPDWLIEAIREDRASLLRSDAFRSLIFVTLAMGLIWGLQKQIINVKLALLGIALLTSIDMYMVDRRFVNADKFTRNPERTYFAENEVDKLIKTDEASHFRVLNLLNPFNEARTSYHHCSIGGYHGAKMRRYQDLIENHLQVEIQEAIEKLRNRDGNFNSLGVINMLNTKYFTVGNTKSDVVGNASANGPAWFVQKVKKVVTPDEEMRDIGNANTKVVAIVDTTEFEVHDREGYYTGGKIDLIQNNPDHLIYEIEAAGNAFAVFSEIYYPIGWTATIDGEEVDILRTNYLLRGLEIPEGNHTVEFKFEPASYTIGNAIMWVCNILLIMLTMLFLIRKVVSLPSTNLKVH